jgi:hypothetical protein
MGMCMFLFEPKGCIGQLRVYTKHELNAPTKRLTEICQSVALNGVRDGVNPASRAVGRVVFAETAATTEASVDIRSD